MTFKMKLKETYDAGVERGEKNSIIKLFINGKISRDDAIESLGFSEVEFDEAVREYRDYKD